jgi:hypothetical protein
MAFKPKPIVHFEEPSKDSGRTFVIMKPCRFCNQGFHYMDVAITFCKHTFHPFCLGVVLKESNKCCVCNVTFHLDWWTSWGFWELDEELCELVKEMNLDQTWQDIMTKAKEVATCGLQLKPKGMFISNELAYFVLYSKNFLFCYGIFSCANWSS